jgi:hypothetical protein
VNLGGGGLSVLMEVEISKREVVYEMRVHRRLCPNVTVSYVQHSNIIDNTETVKGVWKV